MTTAPRASWRDSVDRTWTGDWALPRVLCRPLTPDERLDLVALSMSGLGPAGLARELATGEKIGDVLARREFAPPRDQVVARLTRARARAIVPGDDEYPPGLAIVAAPPPLLFVRGSALHPAQPAVAIVGARICTRGGARLAADLAEELAASGMTIVSGLARGIDAAAHTGALRRGRTIAVLGTGIDIVYPSEHRALRDAIIERGNVVTEFPPGVRPKAWHFPARNRLIAALSIAVVVVEAGDRSGSLITADFALDQGREVFACTVSPTSPSGAGVREMIKDGAPTLVDARHGAELLREYAQRWGHAVAEPALEARVPPEMSDDAAALYAAILEDTTLDELVGRTGLPVARVLALVAALELEGVIQDDGGGRWRRST